MMSWETQCACDDEVNPHCVVHGCLVEQEIDRLYARILAPFVWVVRRVWRG